MAHPRSLRRMLASALLFSVIAIGILSRPAPAHFWPDDWVNRKHDLKVCVDPRFHTPAFADSVAAAMRIWNDAHLTWSFAWADSCSVADVVIRRHDFQSHDPENTALAFTSGVKSGVPIKRAIIYVNSNAGIPWGWCDDKYEIVSTLAHELGHTARLTEAPCQ